MATKATKGHLKRLERLGTKEEELVQLRKSHTQSNVDLAEVIRLNKILRKKNEAKEPLPQQVPAKNLFKALPKVHLVEFEEKVKASEAWSLTVVQKAVYTVFDALYNAIESSCGNLTDGHTAVEEQVTAKSIVDACYLVIYGQTRKPKIFTYQVCL